MSTFSLKNNTELGFFPCATHTELFPPIAESDFQVIFINVSHFKYSNPYNKMPINIPLSIVKVLLSFLLSLSPV